jgi:hypothetical protein
VRSGERLSDRVAIGVLTTAFPPSLVDSVLAATGRVEQRSRLLPARLMVKTVWNRVHLDVRPYPGDDLEAEAARLRTLGATAIDLGQSDVPWTVLADPEGNEFCLLAPG